MSENYGQNPLNNNQASNGYGTNPTGDYVPGAYSAENSASTYGTNSYGSADGSWNNPSTNNGYNYNPYGGAPAKAAGSGLAIASLVLGILALLTCLVFGIGAFFGLVGLILGIIALVKLRKTPGSKKGMAIAGLITSGIGLIVGAIIFIFTVFVVGLGMEGAEACQQYMNDSVAYEQCIDAWANDRLGVETSNYSDIDSQDA